MKNSFIVQPLRDTYRIYITAHTEGFNHYDLDSGKYIPVCLTALELMATSAVLALLSACAAYPLYLLMSLYGQVFILGPITSITYAIVFFTSCGFAFVFVVGSLPIIMIHSFLIPALCLYFIGKLIINYFLTFHKHNLIDNK